MQRGSHSPDVAIIDGVFVRGAGPESGTSLILVHAFADNGSAFARLFATPLAQRFRLIAPDLPGFGASPRQDNVRTLAEHAAIVTAVANSASAAGPIGLVAHSAASMIAVEAAHRLGTRFCGLFAIEGNLTADDAYFSGRAADFDDPAEFKQRFLDDIWTLARSQHIMRRYFGTAIAADALAMWHLGRDARRASVGDSPGQAYRCVQPSLYYWSTASTTEATRRWIVASGLAHRHFSDASHWPMIDQPDETARAIDAFFGNSRGG